VAVICLTLITSKPRLTSPSDISSAGVLCGRWRITAFMGFSGYLTQPDYIRDTLENASYGP
jgi:hypothetical protein